MRIAVRACGVCHTELDEIEGRTPPSALPRILGHQAVGIVDRVGADVHDVRVGERVGVAWIRGACGICDLCTSGLENLCARFEATGRDADGGYAEWMIARADYVYIIPAEISDTRAAPLLCAGAIGYRSLALCGIRDGQPLGLTGFGASGHLVLAMARHLYPSTRVYVFARSDAERAFARELGAVWTGDTGERVPEPLAAIIDTTPAWRPVVRALENLAPGGRLVVNAIRKEHADQAALLELDYATHLWREKSIQSVANVTRSDVRCCLELARTIPLQPTVSVYPLDTANDALLELKQGGSRGAKVLLLSAGHT
ncbi:MAG TPA: alcohol dehydrogenase catalytic domain-containing protein [Vicinamibacterales bacterium]|nr:alcohol dehydrogenase catalytic domain-containing protein [Vicinamibacterales bacterium]